MENKKASQTLAKYVFTLDGECHGYILENIFDQDFNRLVGFKVADDENESEAFLPVKDVKIFGKDCVFAASIPGGDIPAQNNPIGKPVFDSKGNMLGQVEDVVLNGWRIKSLIVGGQEIFAKNVHFVGKNAIILNKKPQKNIFLSIRTELTGNEPMVEIQAQPQPQSSVKIGHNQSVTTMISSPKRIVLNPPSLVGKVAGADVVGLNNEIIIKKGQIINQQKIDIAKKHGKLNLLIINAK